MAGKITDFISSYYEKTLIKSNKLYLSAREARKIRACISELKEIERVATEYRELLQARLDYTKRDDEVAKVGVGFPKFEAGKAVVGFPRLETAKEEPELVRSGRELRETILKSREPSKKLAIEFVDEPTIRLPNGEK